MIVGKAGPPEPRLNPRRMDQLVCPDCDVAFGRFESGDVGNDDVIGQLPIRGTIATVADRHANRAEQGVEWFDGPRSGIQIRFDGKELIG